MTVLVYNTQCVSKSFDGCGSSLKSDSKVYFCYGRLDGLFPILIGVLAKLRFLSV